jgi:undecaprenyl-diphosphatase
VTALLIRLRDFDERLLAAMVLRRRPALDRSFGLLTHAGGATSTISLALLAAFGLIPGVGSHAVLMLVVTHVTVQLMKRMFSRTRPELPVGFGFLATPPDRFSFPSGHAAVSLAVALPFIAALPASAGAAVLALTLLVGISRCYLGVHYPGDVLMGWALAGAAFLILF